MPTFQYKARDSSGKLIDGTIEADRKEEIVDKLSARGCMATKITEVSKSVESSTGAKPDSIFDRFQRIKTQDIIMFNIQLANMINAGITLLETLEILIEQIENKKFKKIVSKVYYDIQAGNSFSQALEKHPKVFSKLFVSLVKAGEASGRLPGTLTRFSEYLEDQEELRRKINEALFYPIMLLFAAVSVTLYLTSSVIPQFVKIFLQADIPVPLATLILYKIGLAIRQYWYLLILGVILIFLGITYYIHTENGRLNFDRFKLKMPVIGILYRKVIISKFARTLGSLMESGVPILECLDLVRDVVGNVVFVQIIAHTHNSIEKGGKLADNLKSSGEFPIDTVQMIAVGEETGDLSGMLEKISSLYEISIKFAVKKMTMVLEQILLLGIGLVVLVIMLSLILPIFNMIKVIKH